MQGKRIFSQNRLPANKEAADDIGTSPLFFRDLVGAWSPSVGRETKFHEEGFWDVFITGDGPRNQRGGWQPFSTLRIQIKMPSAGTCLQKTHQGNCAGLRGSWSINDGVGGLLMIQLRWLLTPFFSRKSRRDPVAGKLGLTLVRGFCTADKLLTGGSPHRTLFIKLRVRNGPKCISYLCPSRHCKPANLPPGSDHPLLFNLPAAGVSRHEAVYAGFRETRCSLAVTMEKSGE